MFVNFSIIMLVRTTTRVFSGSWKSHDMHTYVYLQYSHHFFSPDWHVDWLRYLGTIERMCTACTCIKLAPNVLHKIRAPIVPNAVFVDSMGQTGITVTALACLRLWHIASVVITILVEVKSRKFDVIRLFSAHKLSPPSLMQIKHIVQLMGFW